MGKTYFVLSAECVEDESWKAIPEGKFRPVLRRQPRKSREPQEPIPPRYSRAEESARS